MTHDALLALTLFALVSSITPGPNNTMLLASGVNFGLRRTVPHMLGVNLGFAVLALAAALGLAGLFAAVPALYTVLRWGGAAYLMYLAWKIAHAAAPSTESDAAAKPMTFLQAVAFQWINPKAWIMAVTAITTYAPVGQDSGETLSALIVITLVFTAVNAPCILAWAAAGVALRQVLSNPRALRIFNITMAVLLIASLYPLLDDLKTWF